MKKIFINFTNHPSDKWEQKQRAEAEKYGEVIEFPFPMVSALAKEEEIQELAEIYIDKIVQHDPAAVLCQGEFCLAFHVITGLKQRGITVLAACSERRVKDYGQRKEIEFVFEQFRKY